LEIKKIVAYLKRERDRLNQAITALERLSPRAAAKKSAIPNRVTRDFAREMRGGNLETLEKATAELSSLHIETGSNGTIAALFRRECSGKPGFTGPRPYFVISNFSLDNFS
jgi:hypothetical protein